jgi:hypothetical protein
MTLVIPPLHNGTIEQKSNETDSDTQLKESNKMLKVSHSFVEMKIHNLSSDSLSISGEEELNDMKYEIESPRSVNKHSTTNLMLLDAVE